MQKVSSWIAASILVTLFSSSSLNVLCQTPEQVRRVGQFYARTYGFNGNVVVFRDGVIISNESYGLANVELDVPVTANTRFAIGSVTKQFTAASILLLQERGLLKTTDTLAQRYPETPAAWKDITLRQLLQHTSGIPDAIEVWGTSAFEQGHHKPAEIVQSVASMPLAFEPGSRMSYNNTGYLLLGLIIERVSGKPYGDFLREIFFQPLHMQDTGLGSASAVIPNRAYGYLPVSEGLQVADPVQFQSLFSAGGLYSTGQDLAKWLIALHGGRVLKPASYAEMTTEGLDGFADGLRVSKQDGKLDIGHNGRVSGFDSLTDYFPETKTGIVVLSNKLNRGFLSPGTSALWTDLMHLTAEQDAAVRSLGGSRQIDVATLTRYVGTYIDKADGVTVAIELKDSHLTLTPSGKDTSTLVARSDHAFYIKEGDMEVEFHQDRDRTWLLDIFELSNETMFSFRKNTVN